MGRGGRKAEEKEDFESGTESERIVELGRRLSHGRGSTSAISERKVGAARVTFKGQHHSEEGQHHQRRETKKNIKPEKQKKAKNNHMGEGARHL